MATEIRKILIRKRWRHRAKSENGGRSASGNESSQVKAEAGCAWLESGSAFMPDASKKKPGIGCQGAGSRERGSLKRQPRSADRGNAKNLCE